MVDAAQRKALGQPRRAIPKDDGIHMRFNECDCHDTCVDGDSWYRNDDAKFTRKL